MADALPVPMSCRAYAKSRGLSANAVSVAIAAGRLMKCITRNEFGQPKIADPDLADREWAANTDPQRRINAGGGVDTHPQRTVLVATAPPLRGLMAPDDHGPAPRPAPTELEGTATATERLKSAQADLAELKRDAERGTLVLAKDVERRLIAVFSACKTRLLAIPSRARQALPQLTNADVLVVEGLVREALEELAEAEPAP